MAKTKAETTAEIEPETSYAELVASVSPISHPLASEKLTKKLLKLIKKSTKAKQAKRGVKEVVKALRKNHKGLCIIAGDISPIDVISHLAVLCEDSNTPYVYVPSKQELGGAGQTKRPTSCVLVSTSSDCKELYDEMFKTVSELNESMVNKN